MCIPNTDNADSDLSSMGNIQFYIEKKNVFFIQRRITWGTWTMFILKADNEFLSMDTVFTLLGEDIWFSNRDKIFSVAIGTRIMRIPRMDNTHKEFSFMDNFICSPCGVDKWFWTLDKLFSSQWGSG